MTNTELLENMEIPTHEDNSGQNRIPSIDLLGVRVHRLNMPMTLDVVREFIASGRPHMIVTADSSWIVAAREDRELRDLVNGADLVTPDSTGVLLGAKILGSPLLERVSGVDIAREICRMSAEDGFSIYFLGAEPGIADLAAENLQIAYPGLKVAGISDGYFKPDQDAEVAAKVKASGAQVLLVAMGIPRQEKFIRDYMFEMGVSVAMGVGGSFDVFSGKVKRAPEWYQRHGLEWAYRLAQNPKKISKVAMLPRFLALVIRKKLFGI